MTQSVELLLDEGLDALVRSDWDALAVAGLPSQGRHRSASNRPHVTLAAMKAVDAALEPQWSARSGASRCRSGWARCRCSVATGSCGARRRPDIELLRRQALLGAVLGSGAGCRTCRPDTGCRA